MLCGEWDESSKLRVAGDCRLPVTIGKLLVGVGCLHGLQGVIGRYPRRASWVAKKAAQLLNGRTAQWQISP
jgi:hypothetical protein